MITFESARVLINNLVIAKMIDRQYNDQFAKSGGKIGDTLNIRKPPRFVGRTGNKMSVEAAVETSVPLVLSELDGCDTEWGDDALVLSIDNFTKRFIRPQVAAVSNKVDYKVAGLYKKVFSNTGTPGTVPTSLRDAYMLGGSKLDDNACPEDGQRVCIISSLMHTYIVDALKGLFEATQQIKTQYLKGRMGKAVNFNWYMDQNVNSHTYGTWTTVGTVNGANQTGTSLITGSWSASAALKEGDNFTVAGVNSVNPQNRTDNGQLQDFVITADGTATGAGALTLSISPAITPSGQFKTVTASPANGAVITMKGTTGQVTKQGLQFHPDAFVMASADLMLVNGADMCERLSSPELGISLRLWRDGDIRSNTRPTRLDYLYGYAAVYPELANRVNS